jgi:hypothetical protein
MSKKGRIGSSFDDFLKEDGIYKEVTARAIKRVRARRKKTPNNLADAIRRRFRPLGGVELPTISRRRK